MLLDWAWGASKVLDALEAGAGRELGIDPKLCMAAGVSRYGKSVAVAGAFTLVRFRSVAGNGREMLAIFASMAIGMLLGMGYIAFAVLVFASVAVLFLIVTITGLGERHEVRTLKIRIPEDLDYDGLFDDVFDRYTTMHQLEKVRTVNMGTMYELTYSVSFRDLSKSKQMIDEIRVRNGNLNVSIGSYGEHESI